MSRAFYIVPLLFFMAACSRKLATGLNERNAQEIVVTLREYGIDAATEIEPGSNKDGAAWQVNVRGGSDKAAEAWNILRENGLPRKRERGLEAVFSNSGLIPTAGEEKARLMLALAGELTNTVDSINGVVDAHISVVVPDNNPLLDRNQQNPPTASVLVRYQGSQPPLTEAEVKGLVARGVEGLTVDNVSVVWKRVVNKPLPPRSYGPLLANEWIVICSLTFAGLTSVGALMLVFVSRRQKLQIQKLERKIKEAALSPQTESTPEAVGA